MEDESEASESVPFSLNILGDNWRTKYIKINIVIIVYLDNKAVSSFIMDCGSPLRKRTFFKTTRYNWELGSYPCISFKTQQLHGFLLPLAWPVDTVVTFLAWRCHSRQVFLNWSLRLQDFCGFLQNPTLLIHSHRVPAQVSGTLHGILSDSITNTSPTVTYNVTGLECWYILICSYAKSQCLYLQLWELMGAINRFRIHMCEHHKVLWTSLNGENIRHYI